MKTILTEAVAIGNATARAINFAPRNPRYYIWPDRKWNTPFTGGGNYAFYDNGERMLDDRISMHYYATGITPAMTAPKVGLGSVYGIAAQDVNGITLMAERPTQSRCPVRFQPKISGRADPPLRPAPAVLRQDLEGG